MVKVLPKNETMRKLLRHPSNNMPFPAEGGLEWPDDSFTARRVADEDVTIVEEKTSASKPASVEDKKTS